MSGVIFDIDSLYVSLSSKFLLLLDLIVILLGSIQILLDIVGLDIHLGFLLTDLITYRFITYAKVRL